MTLEPQNLRSLSDERLLGWPALSRFALLEAVDAAGMFALAAPFSADQIRQGSALGWIVDEITRTAAALFPAWLPGAAEIEGPEAGGADAVRVLAARLASKTDLFGPFLTALAEATIHGQQLDFAVSFPPQTVIRECHKLMVRAYGGRIAILILEAVDPLDADALAAIQEAAVWIAGQNAFRVWLAGDGVETLERVPKSPAFEGSVGAVDAVARPAEARVTPLAGRPNPLSECENRLEAFLARYEWAAGRAWNQTWASGASDNPIRVDLIWLDERLVIEIDGSDHLRSGKYALDRARDRALQSNGFRVLRFTNAEVAADVAKVASEIRRFLTRTRQTQNNGGSHVLWDA